MLSLSFQNRKVAIKTIGPLQRTLVTIVVVDYQAEGHQVTVSFKVWNTREKPTTIIRKIKEKENEVLVLLE